MISLFVFAVVAAVLVYSLDQLPRQGPDDWSDGPPVHGHTTLEVVWTIIPTILVTAIAIVSAVVLTQNSNAGNDPLKVERRSRSSSRGSSTTTTARRTTRCCACRSTGTVKLHADGERRDPLVLGAAVRAEAGRRARAPTQKLVITPNRLGT